MNIDVAKAIKELLFEQEAVILPGLGGFTSSPVVSDVDYVQGTIQPPSRNLSFNENLVINDGMLVNHIQKTAVITAQDAKVAIEQYVEGIKQSLEQREIVDIPGVGRLYKDYEHKIRFMPEGTNFETASFGLPNVQFAPVVRQKAPSTPAKAAAGTTAAATTTTTAPPPPQQRPKQAANNRWAEKLLPYLIVAAAILLAFSLFMGLRGCNDDENQGTVPQERINVKPTQEEEQAAQPSDEPTAAVDDNATSDDASTESTETTQPPAQEPEEEVASTTTQAAPPSNNQGNTFIVIHSFGDKTNATKFSNKLKRAGYTPTTKFHGGLNRVGVETPRNDREEVEALIEELGAKFKSKPVEVDY